MDGDEGVAIRWPKGRVDGTGEKAEVVAMEDKATSKTAEKFIVVFVVSIEILLVWLLDFVVLCFLFCEMVDSCLYSISCSVVCVMMLFPKDWNKVPVYV